MNGWMDAAVYRQLRTWLLMACERNAETGYPNGALPAPEVFERPGWRVFQAMPGVRSWRVCLLPAPTPARVVDDGIPSSMFVGVSSVEVRPAIDAVVQVGPVLTWYGLGFDVETRVWVMFGAIESVPARPA